MVEQTTKRLIQNKIELGRKLRKVILMLGHYYQILSDKKVIKWKKFCLREYPVGKIFMQIIIETK